MKATFEFDLPAEQDEFRCHAQAIAAHTVLEDVMQRMRSIRKYESEKYGEEARKLAAQIEDYIFQALEDEGVRLYGG